MNKTTLKQHIKHKRLIFTEPKIEKCEATITLRKRLQKRVAKILGSIPFLAEWERTSRRNAKEDIF